MKTIKNIVNNKMVYDCWNSCTHLVLNAFWYRILKSRILRPTPRVADRGTSPFFRRNRIIQGNIACSLRRVFRLPSLQPDAPSREVFALSRDQAIPPTAKVLTI